MIPSPVRIFISYARKDLEHLNTLEVHLANLKRQGLIEVWTDQKLQAGIEWSSELLGKLRSAEIVLLLLSPDMMASDFIHDVELHEILERHKRGETRVVPVIVRPIDLTGHPLSRFQGLPRNFKPVTEWSSRDAAWVDVVKELRPLIESLRGPGRAGASPRASVPNPSLAVTSGQTPDQRSSPAPGATQERSSPTLTLLHLSDLHFGQAGSSGRIHFDQRKVVSELLKDAALMRETLGSPDAVLITGDVAFSAEPEQYRMAEEWLRSLGQAVGVLPDRIWLVPGNHDVARELAIRPLSRRLVHQALRAAPHELNDYLQEENRSEFEGNLWPKLQAFADFARPWASPPLAAGQPFWRKELNSSLGRMVVLGLNTCLLSLDDADGRANLALSQAQLHRLFDRLPSDALILSLLHHPPEWLLDGEELLKELQKYPHLLFSGHFHQPGGGVVQGLGQNARLRFDAGVTPTAAHEPGTHGYAWIRLSSAGLDWYPRLYSSRWNALRADAERLEEGQRCQHLEPGQLPKRLKDWLARPPSGASVSPGQAGRAAPRLSREPQALIQSLDRVLVVEMQGQLAASELETWKRLAESIHVHRLSEQKPEWARQLQSCLDDFALWDQLSRWLENIALRSLEGLQGQLHLFVSAPYAAGMLLARFLDRDGRQVRKRFYQYDSHQKQWLLCTEPGERTSVNFFEAPPAIAYPFGSDVVLSIEFRSPSEETLTRLAQRARAGALHRLISPGGRHLTSLEEAAGALHQLEATLERIRSSSRSDATIHVLTSAPLALMMAVAETLRETVYHRVNVYNYDPREQLYKPIVELIRKTSIARLQGIFYIDHLELSAIRRFRETSVTIPARPGWIVVAGVNGGGKSSLLQAIGLAILGRSAAEGLQSLYPFEHWLSKGSSEGWVNARLRLQSAQQEAYLQLRLVWSIATTGELQVKENGSDWPPELKASLREQLFFAGYGPFRRITGHSESPQKHMQASIGRILNLFREDVSLADAIEWLRERHREKDSIRISQVIELLNDGLLPELGSGQEAADFPSAQAGGHEGARGRLSLRISRVDNDGVWIEKRFWDNTIEELPLDVLSDGYRCMIALVVDLFERIVIHAETHRLNDPFETVAETSGVRCRLRCPGIVFVDEIDAHLHLSWQRTIGFWLKAHFPDIQFIVTTHSPHICQAAEENGLIRLPPPADKAGTLSVIRSPEQYTILNGEADDAALSSLFGLLRTHSEVAEKLHNQVAGLEAKVARRAASEEDLKALETLAEKLPEVQRAEVLGMVRRARRLP